ncbi:hypothetical protein BT69DRAFT_1276879 [Atractiella rhizophila]|nr:hypothetical protein BT69DRAFT_1276879 [Atractiella rhizophila]
MSSENSNGWDGSQHPKSSETKVFIDPRTSKTASVFPVACWITGKVLERRALVKDTDELLRTEGKTHQRGESVGRDKQSFDTL